MANNNNSSTGSGGDFLAFSQPDQQQASSAAQRSHNFRPYNYHRNQQYFSPQGSSSPIGGNFRGGDARPRFNDAPENGGGGGGGRRGGGGNRSFGRHRQQFNRRGGHHHNNSRGGSGSFQRIHFQAAGSGEVRFKLYFDYIFILF